MFSPHRTPKSDATFPFFSANPAAINVFLRLVLHLGSRGPALKSGCFSWRDFQQQSAAKTQLAAEVKLQSALWSLARLRPIEMCILEESRETMPVGERGRTARTGATLRPRSQKAKNVVAIIKKTAATAEERGEEGGVGVAGHSWNT